MMVLLQVAFVLMIGSALSASSGSLDIPKYLQAMLSDYKFPKGAFQRESETQKLEPLDLDMSILSHLETLLQLRRDLYHAYNLANQIKDPISRMLYRNKHGDGTGTVRGSMNFEKDDGSVTVINYSLQIEEHPTPSPSLTLVQLLKPTMRSSVERNQMLEESSSEEEWPRVITLSRASQKLKSITMDDKGKLFHQSRFLAPPSDMKDDSAFDDLETLSSQWMEQVQQAPDYLSGDTQGSPSVFTIKPQPRGYEQVFKRGEGIVVDKEYDLPYDYRSQYTHGAAFDDDDEQPLYVHHTKPAVKVIEVSRELDGNHQIPVEYRSNMEQQGHEEGALYTTHVMPAVNVMALSTDEHSSHVSGESGREQLQKPAVKVIEVSRELDGNYQIPVEYRSNMEQQGREEEALYTTHVMPAVNVMESSNDEHSTHVSGESGREQHQKHH